MLEIDLIQYHRIILVLFLLSFLLSASCAIKHDLQTPAVILDVPFYQQTGAVCGPLAVKTIGEYWGLGINISSFENKGNNIDGATLKTVMQFAKNNGLNTQITPAGIGDIIDHIDAKTPVAVIVNMNPALNLPLPYPFLKKSFWGHVMVVTGYGDNGKFIYAHGSHEKNISFSASDFLSIWQQGDYLMLTMWPKEKR